MLLAILDTLHEFVRKIIAVASEPLGHYTVGQVATWAAVSCGGLYGAWKSYSWVQRFEQAQAEVRRIRTAAFYSELDKFYADLLRIAIERPHLRQPHRIASDDEVFNADYVAYPAPASADPAEIAARQRLCTEYDAYAFMVWNFIETIHDRCDEFPDDLLGTWATIVAAENRIHRGWFLQQIRAEAARRSEPGHEPSDKFCEPFQVFVVEKNFLPVRADNSEPDFPNWSYKDRRTFKRPLTFKFG